MATRTQQLLIAILTPLTLGSVLAAGGYYLWKSNPDQSAEIRKLKMQIADLDRKTKQGLDASNEARKKKKQKKAYVEPKPLDPIDWSPKKIRALKDADTKRFAEQMMAILTGGARDEAWKATVNLALLEERALPAIRKNLTHPKAKVRYFCLRTVSLMKRAPVPLNAMKPLATDTDTQVRCALARALGNRLPSLRQTDKPMAQVRRTLAALLDDRESIVRSTAAVVLEQARLEAMAGPLLKALDRKSIGREEQHRICSALESTFSFSVGIEYQPAPALPADQDRRVRGWQEWGKQHLAREKSLKGGTTADAESID